jgi:hypothetical protein
MYRVELPRVEQPVIATEDPCAVLRDSETGITGARLIGTGDTARLAPVSKRITGKQGELEGSADEIVTAAARGQGDLLSGPRGRRLLKTARENFVLGGEVWQGGREIERTVAVAK